MKVSWILLTHNRSETVYQSYGHNKANAGAEIDELIWCDNGSQGEEYQALYDLLFPDAEVSILNASNRGVARGYNSALGLASGTHFVITGCDVLMPDNWLRHFIDYHAAIPGIPCIYTQPINAVRERITGDADVREGLAYQPALALERRFISRELFSAIGYFPEDFGLYGYDDLAWAMRAEQICYQRCVKSYVIPYVAKHLTTEGIAITNPRDGYESMKQKEVHDRRKKDVFQHRAKSGWPRFTPFA
jgi:GT2 family glycosyltransferase